MAKQHRTITLSWPSAALCLPLLACAQGRTGDAGDAGDEAITIGQADEADAGDTADSGEDGEAGSDSAEGGTDGVKLDIGMQPDGIAEGFCSPPEHTPCDAASGDPWHALGLNCPGEPSFEAKYTGHPDALYVHTGQVGTYDPPTYPVHEGSKMLILSTGLAQDLLIAGHFASSGLLPDPLPQLPAPLQTNPVGAQTCTDNPALIGTGDCSNTISAQWMQGSSAYDYAELRLSGKVPSGTTGFSYNLAFLSTEYPDFYETLYNDMYIAWLQSEKWTGNVSFDELGNPISLNAGFLDYKDAPNVHDCPAPCEAPELQGTAMQGHAGTKWLTTTASVVPDEDFVLIFAIFDMSDNILDSAVLLDNFQWNCEGGPPITMPG